MKQRKIRLSLHFMQRWRERVGNSWKQKQIADYIHRHFAPELSQGIEPYSIGNELYYLCDIGRINGKQVFVVLSPGHEGLWSGWYGITVLTNEEDITATGGIGTLNPQRGGQIF